MRRVALRRRFFVVHQHLCRDIVIIACKARDDRAIIVDFAPKPWLAIAPALDFAGDEFAEGIAVEVGHFGAQPFRWSSGSSGCTPFQLQPASGNHVRWRAFRRPQADTS